MKAFVHEAIKGLEGTSYTDMEDIAVMDDEVKVHIRYAGLNHRDLFVLDRHKEEDPPLIIGSDGAGIVEAVGKNVHHLSKGDEVVINAALGWQKKSAAPPPSFQLVGLPGHGTMAEYINVPAESVELKPKHLTWAEAGVLPLAALTAYRALFTRAEASENDTILLPGVGGGAVTYLMLFAKAIGARVIVTSRSEEKRNQALDLGADVAIDSSGNWEEQLNGEKVDKVVETVGAATFNKSLDQLKKGGTIVTFGASAGDEITMDIRKFFYGQFNLLGTTMGSHEEFQEMLAFVDKHQIRPIINRVFPLSAAKEGMTYLAQGHQLGKIAIEIP
ncbi:zinc-binding dehydrogenase [Pontibacillus salicampi]|uniref:Zinc-binding dehydrogenase n=1 Tax=Pontibacillus salicampi TaxID=1449801 RepID=A0ABV6LQ04_9BACI